MSRPINQFEAETLDELLEGLSDLRADAKDWGQSIRLVRPVRVTLWEEQNEDATGTFNDIAIDYLD